jgi:hypothetical protein
MTRATITVVAAAAASPPAAARRMWRTRSHDAPPGCLSLGPIRSFSLLMAWLGGSCESRKIPLLFCVPYVCPNAIAVAESM